MHYCRPWSPELTCVMRDFGRHDWLLNRCIGNHVLNITVKFCQVSIARWSLVRWSRGGKVRVPACMTSVKVYTKRLPAYQRKKFPSHSLLQMTSKEAFNCIHVVGVKRILNLCESNNSLPVPRIVEYSRIMRARINHKNYQPFAHQGHKKVCVSYYIGAPCWQHSFTCKRRGALPFDVIPKLLVVLPFHKIKRTLLWLQLKVSRPRPIFRQIHKTNDTRPWINRDGRGWGSADWGERVWGWVGSIRKILWKEQWERTVGNKTREKTQGKTMMCDARLTKKKYRWTEMVINTDMWFRGNGI